MAAPSPESPRRLNLSDNVVGSIPTVIYIPDFITLAEQEKLLHNIYQAPAPKWKNLKNRRLQNWGGVVHGKGLLPQDLPTWLTKITRKICETTGLFPSEINHVLVNEYLPDQGIMPHQDGPAYYPVVAIISLGSSVVIDFSPHQRIKESSQMDSSETGSMDMSVMLMPCSLLIFKDQAYADYLHGIEDSPLHNLEKVVNMPQCPNFGKESSGSKHDAVYQRTAPRVSLTCRLVLKVHKNLIKL